MQRARTQRLPKRVNQPPIQRGIRLGIEQKNRIAVVGDQDTGGTG